jgi:hypothetical protein
MDGAMTRPYDRPVTRRPSGGDNDVRPRSPLVLATGLALLIVPLVVAPVGARNSAQSEHDRIVAFWTPARLAAAKPRDLTPVGQPAPKARPGGAGGSVTGASWTRGGAVLDKTGKVFFFMDGGYWQCSGSIAQDALSLKSVVLTAGHCGIDETGTLEFATQWMFMPNWDSQPATLSTACDATLYGCWTAEHIYVHYGFAHAGAFNDQAVTHDWTFAVVGLGGHTGESRELDQVFGSYPVTTTTTGPGETVGAFGYPAAGKYHGNDLTYCASPIFVDVSTSSTDATWGQACDMTGGSSGGPWFDDYSATNQSNWKLASLNSYGYSGVKNMYGPRFNAKTDATYSAAKANRATTYGVIVGTAP